MPQSSRSLPTLLLLGVAALGSAAMPALAEPQGPGPAHSEALEADLLGPGAVQLLDQARQALQAGDHATAMARIEAAQTHLLHDSISNNLPSGSNAVAMRDAVPVLDQARQALGRGDTVAAGAAISRARAML